MDQEKILIGQEFREKVLITLTELVEGQKVLTNKLDSFEIHLNRHEKRIDEQHDRILLTDQKINNGLSSDVRDLKSKIVVLEHDKLSAKVALKVLSWSLPFSIVLVSFLLGYKSELLALLLK